MDTNIVNSGKKRKAQHTKPANKINRRKPPHVKFPQPTHEEDNDVDLGSDSEDDLSEAEFDTGIVSDHSEDDELSEYDMDDVSDDESEQESDNLEFSDAEDSDSDFQGEIESGCKVVSSELAEQILSDAKKLHDSAIRRLIVVYGSFIRRAALQSPQMPSEPISTGDTADDGTKGGKRRRSGRNAIASRGLSAKFRNTPNRYAPSNKDVYSYIIMETCSIVEKYLEKHQLSFGNKGIADVATLFRRFFSSTLVLLGFCNDDLDSTRCVLTVLGTNIVMPWIVCLKNLQTEMVKLAASLLTYHRERVVRVHALQLLQRYLKHIKEKDYHRIHIYQTPAGVLKVERLSSQDAHEFCNSSLNFVLSRSYRTLVSASCIERTLKNFVLFKLSQNCVAELFNDAPTANLYTFAFKSIRDLGINVRREWLAINDRKKREKKLPKRSSSHGMVLPVYSWGFVDAINLWVSTLVRCKDRLEQLAYPLVTVISASVKIKLPHVAYMPFVLHMITAMNQLTEGLDRFVPVASMLFNLLEQLRKKDISKLRRAEAKHSKKLLDNSNDIMVLLRLSKKQLHASETYRMLYRHVGLVLTDHVGLISLHPSFPEFTIPITAFLRTYLKNHRVDPAFRNTVSKLLSLIEESSTIVRDKRVSLDMQKRSNMGLKVFTSDAKHIPIYRHRMEQLLRYQQINREKVEGTLSAAEL
ncbi:Noc2p family protein, putative [Babesia ovis]|uniref:Noc2p family protein, putative n=1 Tax=Babesia ovis TaxID=5869 RepID=A0A9W5TAF5_BABOV|nr:Noc2p family protein, putative [Babesia ovis]